MLLDVMNFISWVVTLLTSRLPLEMTPLTQLRSLLQRIDTLGRNIVVQCADEELYENEVILVLLLHHQFNQLDVVLDEGSVLLLPDYTADSFLTLKIGLLSSGEISRDLFFPENDLEGFDVEEISNIVRNKSRQF